ATVHRHEQPAPPSAGGPSAGRHARLGPPLVRSGWRALRRLLGGRGGLEPAPLQRGQYARGRGRTVARGGRGGGGTGGVAGGGGPAVGGGGGGASAGVG